MLEVFLYRSSWAARRATCFCATEREALATAAKSTRRSASLIGERENRGSVNFPSPPQKKEKKRTFAFFSSDFGVLLQSATTTES